MYMVGCKCATRLSLGFSVPRKVVVGSPSVPFTLRARWRAVSSLRKQSSTHAIPTAHTAFFKCSVSFFTSPDALTRARVLNAQGLSSVLDAASRGVKANIKTADERSSTSPTPPAAASTHDSGGGPTGRLGSDETRPSEAPGAKDGSSNSRSSSSSGDGGSGARGGRGGGPDPFDRIGSVALTSLAGSLKILSAAVGGIGDTVFQAGMLAEGLAGGTGQFAGET